MADHRQKRLNDKAQAQIQRENRLADAQLQIQLMQAKSRLRRQERSAERTERTKIRQARRATIGKASTWLRENVVDLLFVPVIVVPAILAATGMAGYGQALYGPLGIGLFVFSEGAMWVCAAAAAIMRHREPGRPIGVMVAGTWLFAAMAFGMNFADGIHRQHTVLDAAMMGAVSVGGVLVHQVLKTGRFRTRNERIMAVRERAQYRQLKASAKLLGRGATTVAGPNGELYLRQPTGAFDLTRDRLGRRRLTRTYVPGLPVEPVTPIAATAQRGELDVDKEFSELTAGLVPELGSGTPNRRFDEQLEKARRAVIDGRLPKKPTVAEVQAELNVSKALCCEVRRALIDNPAGR